MEIENKTLKTLEFDKISAEIAGFARVKHSKDLCFKMSIYSDISKIKKQLEFTREAKHILDMALELPFEGIADIAKLKQNQQLYMSEEEIFDVGRTLKTSRLVKSFLRENLESTSNFNEIGCKLYVNRELEDRIYSTFDSNLEVSLEASQTLKNLVNALRDSEKNLKNIVNNLLNSSEFSKHLQESIYTTRDERIVFQVKASDKSKVKGIVHDVSATGQTFYIEPAQIVPLNNKIREIKSQIHSEIVRILTELTREINSIFSQIEISENILSEIDFHFAKARYAVKLKAIEPEVVLKKVLEIEGMRHPLLIEYVENVVKNDFKIGKDYKSVIITGSNTGGKTVTLKTLGLFVLMTRAGIFLPCDSAKIYPFPHIFADIGDEQSIAQSLSTFSSHMKNIIEITNNCDDETFVLLDEICAGTDPEEGSVLATVILNSLRENGVTSCVTTHYGELKSLEYANSYFKNASVEFDIKTLKPTFKLVIGIPGLSNAIAISETLGLNKNLVDMAKDALKNQDNSSIDVVEKLQEKHFELAENLKTAQEAKEEAVTIKKDLETNLEKVKKEKKKVVKTAKERLDGELERAKNEIKDILYEIRHEKSEKIARRSYSRLGKVEKHVRNQIDMLDESQKYIEIIWEEMKIGDNAMLKDLHTNVTILSLPDKNGNVFVQMGNVKTKINKKKLAYADEKYTPPKLPNYNNKEKFELKRIDMSNTLDLRGFRVEDALDTLENYLDKASLVNLTPIYIIHGHGTGALKSSIREFLSTSPYVAKFRVGEAAEGGDGVSVVDIN